VHIAGTLCTEQLPDEVPQHISDEKYGQWINAANLRREVDTITPTLNIAGASVLGTPAGNTHVLLKIPLIGFQKIEFWVLTVPAGGGGDIGIMVREMSSTWAS
jgi:hypothetical protein